MNSVEEVRFLKLIDRGLQEFYGYGKMTFLPIRWSACTIILFGVILFVFGMDGHQGKDGRCVLEWFGQQNDSAKSRHRDWWGGLRAVADAMLFSATVFLSGARLFVEPPAQPEVLRLSANRVKWAMIFERVLGALFSILFFLAISGTVIR